MQDIGQVLRRKRAQYAQLTREIQILEQAEQTLREVAPLLADGDEEESSLLADVEDDVESAAPAVKAAAAAAGSTPGQADSANRPAALRWP